MATKPKLPILPLQTTPMKLIDPKIREAAMEAFVSEFRHIELKHLNRGLRNFIIDSLYKDKEWGFCEYFDTFLFPLENLFALLDKLEDLESDIEDFADPSDPSDENVITETPE
jgi:hypothetical protein